MSDVDRYHALVDELREVIIRLHAATPKREEELLKALQEAARHLKKARKNGAIQ